MLFLLTDRQGRGIVIAEALDKTHANAFGYNYLQNFSGDSLEIDAASRADAEELWGVETVQLKAELSTVWVHGPSLPEEIEGEDCLTPEDHRDLTLDHIERTCDVVVKLQIVKFS
ncbi:MAG TPA: hypothetical protein VEX68_22160 [Bryobacteraceae bacterium]|nr:hypothetical protein [Bryobacteraceae bacterium]